MLRHDNGSWRLCSTLIDVLCFRAERQPEDLACSFLRDGEQDEVDVSYRELERQARALGAWLQQNVASAGQRVLLLIPPGLDFLAGFLGCVYGGMIAVPAYPPHSTRHTRSLSRLEAIVENASPAAVFTTAGLLPAVQQIFDQTCRCYAIDDLLATEASELSDRWTRPDVSAQLLAMLQYTSGSTGAPNGVMLSHGNLLHNSEQIRLYYEHSQASRVFSWLPPYHDMGLIGCILQPLYLGCPLQLMSPMHFLQQPIRWLRAISDWKATTSGGPNFAYDLCVDRFDPEVCARLDLSTWSVAFNGAEPVRAQTLDRFAATFEPYGFRREAFYPCYGLAEGTLMVSGGWKSAVPFIEHVQADDLRAGRVVSVPATSMGAQSLVSCGRSIPGQEIMIVDPERCTECAPATVGEIWIRGPSVTHGYWQRPELTKATFEAFMADTGAGPYLRTGDLGFLKDGELFVTGRSKDLIILDGRNHYPQDIELTVEQSHPGIRRGCCVAFSVDESGAERLVVLAEVDRAYWSGAKMEDRTAKRENGESHDADERSATPNRRSLILKAIRRAVSEKHETQVAEVLLLKPASIAKTPSGKHQRRACREAFLKGALREV